MCIYLDHDIWNLDLDRCEQSTSETNLNSNVHLSVWHNLHPCLCLCDSLSNHVLVGVFWIERTMLFLMTRALEFAFTIRMVNFVTVTNMSANNFMLILAPTFWLVLGWKYYLINFLSYVSQDIDSDTMHYLLVWLLIHFSFYSDQNLITNMTMTYIQATKSFFSRHP